jgi:chromosome segregation ATPase
VTGGAAVRDNGVLARERELRELPEAITQLELKLTEIGKWRSELGAASSALTDEQTRLQSQLAGLMAQQRERNGQRQRLETA